MRSKSDNYEAQAAGGYRPATLYTDELLLCAQQMAEYRTEGGRRRRRRTTPQLESTPKCTLRRAGPRTDAPKMLHKYPNDDAPTFLCAGPVLGRTPRTYSKHRTHRHVLPSAFL